MTWETLRGGALLAAEVNVARLNVLTGGTMPKCKPRGNPIVCFSVMSYAGEIVSPGLIGRTLRAGHRHLCIPPGRGPHADDVSGMARTPANECGDPDLSAPVRCGRGIGPCR